MTASVWFAADGEAATRSATDALIQRGFRVVRSFDLRSAVAGQAHCTCPHHGTDRCTCQYVVLLAYPVIGTPVVITAHSCEARAELQIVDDPNAPIDPAVSEAVAAALAEAAFSAPAGSAWASTSGR